MFLVRLRAHLRLLSAVLKFGSSEYGAVVSHTEIGCLSDMTTLVETVKTTAYYYYYYYYYPCYHLYAGYLQLCT